MGLNHSSFHDESKKRKARAEHFGAPAEEFDAEAEKAAECAKRFGTDTAANGRVGKLDEALLVEKERRGKQGRDGESSLDDPGLKPGRGGKRCLQGRDGRNDSASSITPYCFTSNRSSASCSGLTCSATIATIPSSFSSNRNTANCSGLNCSATIATTPGCFTIISKMQICRRIRCEGGPEVDPVNARMILQKIQF